MPPSQADWISVGEASAIISKNSGHYVSPHQVRRKANEGHIEWHEQRGKGRGGFVRIYKLSDVEKVRIQKHGGMYANTEPPKEVVTE